MKTRSSLLRRVRWARVLTVGALLVAGHHTWERQNLERRLDPRWTVTDVEPTAAGPLLAIDGQWWQPVQRAWIADYELSSPGGFVAGSPLPPHRRGCAPVEIGFSRRPIAVLPSHRPVALLNRCRCWSSR